MSNQPKTSGTSGYNVARLKHQALVREFIKGAIVFGVIVSTVLVMAVIKPAHAQTTGAANSAEARLMATLKRTLPSTQVTSVEKTPIAGLFEVVMGQNIAYVDGSGRYFLIGRMMDMQERIDITASTKERIAKKITWNDLPLQDAIRFGNGKQKVAVFSDPDCPFCRQLEVELDKLQNVTVYVFPYPIAALHPKASSASQAIWCARDRAKAWKDYLLQRQLPTSFEACDASAIQRNVALAERLGINATPTLIAEDGRMASGASKSEQIQAWLDRGSASNNAQR